MKELYKFSRELFKGWVILMYMLMYTVATGGYFYLISKSVPASLIVGIISSFFMFYAFNIVNGRVIRKEKEMSDLNRYVTTIVFNLKTGKNVMHALQDTRDKSGDLILADIDSAIQSIVDTGDLNLDRFKRHQFKSLDIFHKILNIKYEQGGDTNDLFKNTTKDINFEIGKRDELNRNKGYVVSQEYFMMGIVLAIPLILVFVTGDLYLQYLDMGIVTTILLGVFYTSLLLNLVFLQKKRADINVNV